MTQANLYCVTDESTDEEAVRVARDMVIENLVDIKGEEEKQELLPSGIRGGIGLYWAGFSHGFVLEGHFDSFDEIIEEVPQSTEHKIKEGVIKASEHSLIKQEREVPEFDEVNEREDGVTEFTPVAPSEKLDGFPDDVVSDAKEEFVERVNEAVSESPKGG